MIAQIQMEDIRNNADIMRYWNDIRNIADITELGVIVDVEQKKV